MSSYQAKQKSLRPYKCVLLTEKHIFYSQHVHLGNGFKENNKCVYVLNAIIQYNCVFVQSLVRCKLSLLSLQENLIALSPPMVGYPMVSIKSENISPTKINTRSTKRWLILFYMSACGFFPATKIQHKMSMMMTVFQMIMVYSRRYP